jgi:hypothetical protein
MEQRSRVFTNHKHSFSAPYPPSIPANSNLARIQQGQVRFEKRHQNQEKRRIEKERHPSTKKEKKKEKKEERIHDQGRVYHVGVCVCKESNQTPHLPDPSLQLNVAFGEAQRCALFCPTHAGR